jgi:large subunit ribosomal protein L6
LDLPTSRSPKEEIVVELDIPSSVTASMENNTIRIKGKLGDLIKDVTKMPADIQVRKEKIIITPYGKRKKDLAIAHTCRSIIHNMITGVDKGYSYKLKIVYAHFPISVKPKGRQIHVENFFGERSSRISYVVGDSTKVTVTGDEVLVQGPSLEDVSQTAANIESSTRVKRKDQRVFLDGVYLYARHEGVH